MYVTSTWKLPADPGGGRVADVKERVRGATSYGVCEHATRYLGDELPWPICGAATVDGGSRLFAGRARADCFLALVLEGPGVENLQHGQIIVCVEH